MANHPNIKGRTGIPPSSPSPDQIREIRIAAGLTQTEAAALAYCTIRAWQRWETDAAAPSHRVMPADAWELVLIKLAARKAKMPDAYIKHVTRILETTHIDGYRDRNNNGL